MQSANADDFRRATARCEGKYYPWDKIRFVAREERVDPEVLWAMVKFSRTSRSQTLPLVGAHGVPLTYNVPDIVLEELMHIDQELAGRLVADDEQPLSTANRERFIVSTLRNEAIASSMLEGAATTRRDAKRMLREGRKPRTHGEQMVFNNYRAMAFVRENKDIELSQDFLLEIQQIITEGTLENASEAGRLRTPKETVQVVDYDNEVLHDPPPAEELPRRLRQLCDFANRTNGPFLHPVLRACALHFQIGFDHPFCDGNGRTARAVFYWSMLRAGYWLFEFLPISSFIYDGPSRYSKAFLHTEVDGFDLTHFFVYKAEILRRARETLRQHISRKQQEIARAKGVFEQDRRLNHRQRTLILRVARNPDQTITIAGYGGRLNISYGTARSDLLDLAKWGYLDQHQEGNRFEFTAGPRLADAPPPIP